MTANHSTPRLRLALLGVGGVMLAHIVGYVVAYPDAGSRSLQLAHTGHSYWETAMIVVLFGVLVAVLGELVLSHTRARNGESGSPPAVRRLWSRLAPGQIVAFTLLEVAERAFHGEHASAWTEPSFWAALPVLVLTAWLGALLLRAAGQIGQALARCTLGPNDSDADALWFPPANDAIASSAVLHWVRRRAPPGPLVT